MGQKAIRNREAGITLIEVSASVIVLSIAFLGLAGTVVYQRSLEQSTERLWGAATAATATMESIRAASMSSWDGLTSYDGTLLDPKIGNAIKARLQVHINTDPAGLDNSDGMWTEGATRPNFFHVDIGALNADSEFGNSMRFQTYVADRVGVASGVVGEAVVGEIPPSEDDPAEDPPPEEKVYATEVDKIDGTLGNIVIGGANDNNLTFTVTNLSPSDALLQAVKVDYKNGTNFTYISVGGVVMHDGSGQTSVEWKDGGIGDLATFPPGPWDVQVLGDNSILGTEVKFKLTFTDGSKTEWKWIP